jgi:hypothetical protein
MAVDRAGQVYVTSNTACGDEQLFRCNPDTLACVATPAAQSRNGSPQFMPCLRSMAFVGDRASPTGETLFFIDEPTESSSGGLELGRVDPSTSALTIVAPLSAPATAYSS